MIRHELWLRAAVTLALLNPPVQAQSPSLKLLRPRRPLETAHLDLATGVVTRGPAVHTKAATTVSDFPNNDLGGFVGADTGNCFCEWFDAGTKGKNNNASDLMSEIVFAYCSAKFDPSSGGPGGSVKLGFYEGYTVGGGTPTTAVAVLTLTGLPGNTASSSFFGGFRCFFITVEFGHMVCFADGPIGYSWKFIDVGLGGPLAGTWPFLSCVQSCTGVGPDGLGMVDLIDEYCPPGHLKRTSSLPFTGTPPVYGGYFSSISMDIREAKDALASATAFNGDGINADSLATSTAIVGQDWTAQVTIGHAHGSGGLASIRVRTTSINGGNFPSPIGGRLTELLISGPLLTSVLTTHDGAVSSLVSQPVPKLASLICAPWAAQAVVMGGGFADLSSSAFGVVGTQ